MLTHPPQKKNTNNHPSMQTICKVRNAKKKKKKNPLKLPKSTTIHQAILPIIYLLI